jgi:hypothetical protein
MHVRLDAADLVDEDARRIDAAAAQVVVRDGLDLGDEKRRAFLGVPGDVQVDLRIVVAGHGVSPGMTGTGLAGLRLWADDDPPLTPGRAGHHPQPQSPAP